MVHPVCVDETLLVLKLNGIEKYSFLIDEKNTNAFFPTKIFESEEYIDKIKNPPTIIETKTFQTEEDSKVPLTHFIVIVVITIVAAILCALCISCI